MTLEELRMECLRLAFSTGSGSPEKVVEQAEVYRKFIEGAAAGVRSITGEELIFRGGKLVPPDLATPVENSK